MGFDTSVEKHDLGNGIVEGPNMYAPVNDSRLERVIEDGEVLDWYIVGAYLTSCQRVPPKDLSTCTTNVDTR